MEALILVFGLLLRPDGNAPMIGAGIANSAAPMILMAAPPLGHSLFIEHVACGAVDGVDGVVGNSVTFNDTKATVLPLNANNGDIAHWPPAQDIPDSANPPPRPAPMQFDPGQAATFRVALPSVVKCTAQGYVK